MAANQERSFVREAAVLLAGARAGSLATVADGAPHAALVTPALDERGDVLLLLSDLSAHTKHLRANAAAALLVTGAAASENPQTSPRLLVSGEAAIVADAAARELYLRFHPYAAGYADFTDFHFWKLTLKAAHYVGGFAAAAPLDPAALRHEINALRAPANG